MVIRRAPRALLICGGVVSDWVEGGDSIRDDSTTMILYLDESGDLGFGQGSTTYFVMGFLAVTDEEAFRRKIRKIKRRAGLSGQVELKAYHSDDGLRAKVLRAIAASDVEVHTVSVYKPRVYDHLRTDTNVLYNYTAKWLLIPFLEERRFDYVRIVVDLRITRQSRGMRFDDYVKAELWGDRGVSTRLEFQHQDSAHSLGLQAVDFVTHALFRARERNDWQLWNIVRGKAKRTRRLLFDPETKKPTLEEGGP